MGVYVIEPKALENIEPDQRLDLPDLVQRSARGRCAGGRRTCYDGYWLDIGRHEDYEKAILEFEQVKPLLMDERPTSLRDPRSSQQAPPRPTGRSMTVRVTGGAGYVGALVVDELLDAGREVRVLDVLLHGQDDVAAELAGRGRRGRPRRHS